MRDLYKRFIIQLDSLVPFIALGHKEIYEVLEANHSDWYPDTNIDNLTTYQIQVSHAAFLLGFSYFEAFLADVVKEAFARRPNMLPKNKNLKYEEVLKCDNYDDVIAKMIETETYNIFFGSFENIGEFFTNKLSLPWLDTRHIKEASFIRNCIIHNNSIVDQRLSDNSNYELGATILLTATEVHDFGIAIRQLAHEIDQQFDSHYSL